MVLSSEILLIGFVRVKTKIKASRPWLDRGAVTQASKSLFKASTSSLNLVRATVLTKVQLELIKSSQAEGCCWVEATADEFFFSTSWSSEDDSSCDCCCGCIIGGGIMNIIGCCTGCCCLRARLRSRSLRPMMSKWQQKESTGQLTMSTNVPCEPHTYIQQNCQCQSNQNNSKNTSNKFTHIAGCCFLDVCKFWDLFWGLVWDSWRFFLGFGLRFFEIFFLGFGLRFFEIFFWALVWDFLKCLKIFLRFLEISWHFLRFFEIFWDFFCQTLILKNVFWDFLRFFEIFWDSNTKKCIWKKALEIFWDFFLGTLCEECSLLLL